MSKDWRDKVRNPSCEECSLHESAEHVCLMGGPNIKAKIMVVGEAPGAREDEEHQAFVGPSGQYLMKALGKVGLNREDLYITNAAKCRPPDNRAPTKSEVRTCASNYLLEEIERLQPDFVLALGNSALGALTKRSGITKHRGSPILVPGMPVIFPTLHPSAVLRNPRYTADFEGDLLRFSRLVRGQTQGAPTRVKLVKNKAQLVQLVRVLNQVDTIAFDLETTGLKEYEPEAKIVSISFTWREGLSVVVPIYHESTTDKWAEIALKTLKPCLERKDCKYIAHNGKFDCKWLAATAGIFVPLSFDTMLAAHIVEENRSKSLKSLAQTMLGVGAWDLDSKENLYEANINVLAKYNGKDTDYTLRLRNILAEQLKEEPRSARVFLNLMMPASRELTKIERAGLYVDGARLKSRTKKARRNLEIIEEYLYTKGKAPPGTNFRSPKQVAEWLFGRLKLPIIAETPTGAPATNESVLLRLQQENPVVRVLLEHRKWTKYLSTYLDRWDLERDQYSRLHTTYKLHGTVTGRISSESPNLQQVPRDKFIRSIIGAPEGWKLVSLDYSQIELRIAAMIAGEKRMLAAFAKGDDLHFKTAVEVVGLMPDEVDKETRKKAKAINFGFIYGMGAAGFVDYAFDKFGLEVTVEAAETIRAAYFETYPALRTWHNRQKRLAYRYQRVNSPLGRTRHLPDVLSTDKGVRAQAERQAINSPVQSFASDLMLLSLVRISETADSRICRPVATVHDQILLEVRESHVDSVVQMAKAIMEDTSYLRRKFGVELTVPLVADVEVSQHWGE